MPTCTGSRAISPMRATGTSAPVAPSQSAALTRRGGLSRLRFSRQARRVLPRSGLVLEIASGTGEHAVHFAGALPGLTWQPSDPDETARRSIEAHRDAAGLPNLRPPLALDAAAPIWPVERADAVVAINLVHIAPWAATLGLMAGGARVLPPDGVLVLYGPYKEDGAHTAPSNAAFDASLKAQNSAWGVRDLEEVEAAAQA